MCNMSMYSFAWMIKGSLLLNVTVSPAKIMLSDALRRSDERRRVGIEGKLAALVIARDGCGRHIQCGLVHHAARNLRGTQQTMCPAGWTWAQRFQGGKPALMIPLHAAVFVHVKKVTRRQFSAFFLSAATYAAAASGPAGEAKRLTKIIKWFFEINEY